MIPLRKAVQPGVASIRPRRHPSVCAGRRSRGKSTLPRGRKQFRAESALYVATPAVLRYLGIDPATIDPGTDFLADRSVTNRRARHPEHDERGGRSRGHERPEDRRRAPPVRLRTARERRRRSSPSTVSAATAGTQIPAGWLVESSRPLTSDQIADARNVAANAGLTIEVQRGKPSFAKTMAIATGAGALLALAILAMTVGLIRRRERR